MSMFWRGGLALLAVVIGAALWSAGHLESRKVQARQQLVTMRYGAPLAELEALGQATRFAARLGLARHWRGELDTRRAESRYWLGDYAAVTASTQGTDAEPTAPTIEEERSDPELLLLAANAAYRQLPPDLPPAAAIDRLERIGGLYLDALRRDPTRVDAAFNYEFVARSRDLMARDAAATRRGRTAAGVPRPTPRASIHGLPGAAPADADMGDFKIIIPDGPDSRQQQPDAGLSGPKGRKG